MTARVLILGGYGNFGSFISKTLAEDKNITVIVAGRCKKQSPGACKQYSSRQ